MNVINESDTNSSEWAKPNDKLELLLEIRPINEDKPAKECKTDTNEITESGEITSEFRSFTFKSYKQLANDPVEKFKYILKPCAVIAFGTSFICVGIALTVSHFMYEDSLAEDFSNPPYFTYGPISFATGVILFMIGIVWLSVKHHKWENGTASPIARAVAAAATVAASATFTSEPIKLPGRESFNGLPKKKAEKV